MRASTAVNFEHVDVLVVGAGLTGIGMGYHLTTQQPGKTYAIVDSRDGIGGTWDLFRYPGIRSDADLHTFGFSFKPWTSDNAIADGDESLDYLQETIDENDLGPHIHLGHKVIRAHFSSEEARWTVTLGRTSDGEQFAVCCNMLFSAAGYYDVDHGAVRIESTSAICLTTPPRRPSAGESRLSPSATPTARTSPSRQLTTTMPTRCPSSRTGSPSPPSSRPEQRRRSSGRPESAPAHALSSPGQAAA